MFTRTAVLLVSTLTALPAIPQTAEFGYRRAGGIIEITGAFPDAPLELHIRSARNRRISKLSDRSPHDPGIPRPLPGGKEIWFPVIDVETGPDTDAIASFAGPQTADRYSWNGNFQSHLEPLSEENVLRRSLEYWENAIYVESRTARLTGFAVRKTIRAARPSFRPLTDDWAGTVTVIRRGDDGQPQTIATIDVSPPPFTPPAFESGFNRPQLIEGVKAAIHFLLRSQNRNPSSPTFGGLFLFYDLDASTFRRSDWIWTWGPAMRFLIDAAAIPEIAVEFGHDRLLRAAREMGEASLRFLIADDSHPARGLVVTRFDPTTRYRYGHSGFVSPADAYFLAGWGYIPLYEATGDTRFLDAAKLLLDQTGRLLAQDPVIEQDFVMASRRWKNWTMDESGFGMEGFAEVFRATGDSKYQQVGREYLNSLVRVLGRDDGLWDRTWHRKDPAREDDSWPLPGPAGKAIRVPSNANTRGLAWAMMGLLAAHRLLPDEGHLQAASRMAEHLIRAQRPEGHWTFLYNRPEDEVGIAEKGTAIWSLLLYRLYNETGDVRHLEAARKALGWCMKNRYTGPDALAAGGIIGLSPASGVVYRPWFRLICTYTMSFYGNALLAELNRAEPGRARTLRNLRNTGNEFR